MYENGDYNTVTKHSRYHDQLVDPKVVFVKRDKEKTTEIYFLKNGGRIEAFYVGDKLTKVSGGSAPAKVVFFIPVIGFLIGLYSVIHEVIRTGEMISWRLMRNPDLTEKICYAYTISLFAIGLILLALKQG